MQYFLLLKITAQLLYHKAQALNQNARLLYDDAPLLLSYRNML